MLEEFGTGIWTAEGSVLKATGGFRYPTRMAIIRLAEGRLVLWSPVALTEDLRLEIEKLGRVGYLVAPNSLHHTFLGDWQRAYPDAIVFVPPGLPENSTDIQFDAVFDDDPVKDWSEEIEHVIVWGNCITTEVVFYHHPSRTVIFTDLIQRFPPGWFVGWRALVARLDLMISAQPSVPRKFRFAFTDRHSARKALRTVLAWPAEKVIMAHGQPVTSNGQALLENAFRWLKVNQPS